MDVSPTEPPVGDGVAEEKSWLRFLEEETLNGSVLRGYLAVETHLRTLLVVYAREQNGTTNLADTSTRFNVLQLYELGQV